MMNSTDGETSKEKVCPADIEDEVDHLLRVLAPNTTSGYGPNPIGNPAFHCIHGADKTCCDDSKRLFEILQDYCKFYRVTKDMSYEEKTPKIRELDDMIENVKKEYMAMLMYEGSHLAPCWIWAYFAKIRTTGGDGSFPPE